MTTLDSGEGGLNPRATAGHGAKSASTRAVAVTASPRRLPLWVRFLPIVLMLGYLNFTVFLFAYGPWPWPVVDGTKLYFFLALAHLALFLGYASGVWHRPRGYARKWWKAERIVALSLALNLVLLVPTSAFRTGSGIPNIAAGLADPGLVYQTSNAARAQSGGLVEYVRVVLGPLLFVLLPLTIFYWQRLKWSIKALSVAAIFGFLAIYVAIGTNKALADFVLLTPCLFVASYLAGHLRLSWRFKAFSLVSAVAAFILFLTFFTTAIVSRVKSEQAVSSFPFLGLTANADNFLVRPLPASGKTGAIALASYLTQGYYGLYLALDEPFVPTYGVGNSIFLAHIAARITGNSQIEELAYPLRLLRDGKWDGLGNWSTIYPWIASDVSFPGTLLVVFVIGRLFALSWLDTLRGENPFAVAAFAQFLIVLFYFSANNQALQSGEAATSFIGVIAIWLLTRHSHHTRGA